MARESVQATERRSLAPVERARPGSALAVRDAVQAVIAEHLPSGRPTRGRVARALGLSTRTFQRRLAEVGTRFDQLVREARLGLARRMLARPELTIDAIADATGFYDRTSFCRAFRTWTGVAPSAYRTMLEARMPPREAAPSLGDEVALVLPCTGLASTSAAEARAIPAEFAHLPRSVGSLLVAAPIATLLRQPLMVPACEAVDPGAYCLAVELVEGCSLEQMLAVRAEAGADLPQGLACYIVAQLATCVSLARLRADAATIAGSIDVNRVLIAGDGTVRLTEAAGSPAGSHARSCARGGDVVALGRILHACVRGARTDPALARIVRRMVAPSPARSSGTCGDVVAALAPFISDHGLRRDALREAVAATRHHARRRVARDPRAPLGSVRTEEVAPGVLVHEMAGYLDASWVPRLQAAAQASMSRGFALEQFFDAEAMTGYDAEFRRRMVQWHIDLRPRTRGLHVLVGSKPIALAVAAVNLRTGRLLTPHTTRRSFEAALHRRRA